MSLEGADALRKKLHQLKPAVLQAAKQGVNEAAETILTKAKERTPVEYGNLRASEFVIPPTMEGETIVAQIACGGPAAPYAIYVHERLNVQHKSPTSAKFLEGPALESKDMIVAVVSAHVKKALT